MIAEGRRATLIKWLGRLPAAELTGWLLYWAGVAHLADDAAAERWLSRAWETFEVSGDQRGKCLTMARALLVKTDSWRTHEGLAAWTRRAMAIAGEVLAAILLRMRTFWSISVSCALATTATRAAASSP